MIQRSFDILGLLRSRHLWIFLVLLWALAYLPFLAARDLRQEEGRRAAPAQNMLASGDFLAPRLYGQPYLSKPPGYFWLVAGVGKIQGRVTALTPRIPSVLAVLAGALLMFAFAPRQLPRHTRALAALFLLSTAVLLDKGALGEIDSTLSMLVFATLTVFYNGYCAATANPPRSMFKHWLLIGVLGGAMVLIKGPGGPLEIIPPVLAFLFWEKRLRLLLSPGAIVAILIAAAPTALWMFQLQSAGHFNLAAIYSNQIGLDVATNLAGPHVNDEGASVPAHYLWHFFFNLLTMPLPWLFWALFALLKPKETFLPAPSSPTDNTPRTLHRFLLCSTLIMVLPFYLWPAALGRHVMAVVYPLCLLAAIRISGDSSRPQSPKSHRALLTTSQILALLPALLAVTAILLAALLFRPALALTIPVALLFILLSLFLLGTVNQTRAAPQHVTTLFAAILAIAILSGRYLAAATLIPWKAATDDTRLLRDDLLPLVANPYPLYTMESFRPCTPGLFYDVQFYLGPALKALPTPAWPANESAAIITIIGTREDRAALLNAGFKITDLGQTSVKKPNLPVLYVFQVMKSS